MKITFQIGLLILCLCIGINTQLFSQINTSDWKNSNSQNLTDFQSKKVKISIPDFKVKLQSTNQQISLPTPDGKFETFEIRPVKVVADDVAHLYTIKTYRGVKQGDPTTMIACDISDGGFHAAIYSEGQTYFIEPADSKQPEELIVYYKKDKKNGKAKCSTLSHDHKITLPSTQSKAPNKKRTFRLAIAAAGEYSQQFGGSPYSSTNVLNALASGVNMINPIYLRDVGVEFNLVSNTALVYPNPNTDPFDTNDTDFLTEDSHLECVSALGNNGFDVGHLVVWKDLGGLASFKVVCKQESKGEGYSGSSNSPVTLWVDYVAHELGHQFGSEHNFAADCNSVDNFRYEPGEGSSIMSYADVCGGDDQYATGSDPFFHYASIAQIQTFLNTISCDMSSTAGNSSDPISDAKSNITIPKQTPFILVGSATDANDPVANLTYDWQQYDGNGPFASGKPNCNSQNSPLFRYRSASSNNYRAFPIYNEVLSGNNNGVDWEKLPCASGSINFSMAVRDNNTSFGRVTHDQMVVTVANTGPFEVTAPNGGESYNGNADITWNANGTNAHCPNVDVLLSLDGGVTYTVVADATANDGTHNISFTTMSTQARILVRCDVIGDYQSTSTFYDTGNGNFTIAQPMAVDNDNDSYDSTVDCDDNNPNINPGATEICNGIDDNCNGMTDEGLTVTTYYQDADGDSYGNAAVSQSGCAQPTGYVTDNTDCDDTNNMINPAAGEVCNGIDDNCSGIVDDGLVLSAYYQDADGDSFGNAAVSQTDCAQPTGYVTDNTDCDDTNNMINPAATDIPDNGIDEDCNGSDATNLVDNDNDGFNNSVDCDDNNPNINPGATEICNGIDDNCNGMTDEGLTVTTYYQDADGDSFGNAAVSQSDCAQPTGYVADNTDCDDTNNMINPAATDIPDNGIDEDCNGSDATNLVDNDNDGFNNSVDCDDNNPNINPGATEICNGIDDNCNGMTDEGLTVTTYYQDADGDSFGNAAVSQSSCSRPTGYVTDNTDCDDTNNMINPAATDIPDNGIDEDCNGSDATNLVDNDNDGFNNSVDCDDNNPNINPDATEICNGIDDNCNGMTDEGLTFITYYQDADGDSFGNAAVAQSSCSQPTGYVTDNTDCDDTNNMINPAATDIPDNGIDEDCNGSDATNLVDNDNDGFNNSVDCDDNNPNINPDATEICNGIDDNCNGMTDEGLTVIVYFEDADGDSFGNPFEATSGCSQPTGYVTNSQDCDDTDPDINPDADEICNEIDDNCDGEVDESLTFLTYYLDQDEDGFGDVNSTIEECELFDGYVTNGDDCDDTNPNINPAADDIPDNGIDEDCDGMDALSSIHEISNSTINIYPNPTVGQIFLDIEGQLNFKVNIYDLTGKIMHESKNETAINLSHLVEGIYIIEISDTESNQRVYDKVSVVRY